MELGCRFLVHYICREMLINAYARLCPSVPVCIKIVDGGARRRRRAVCAVPFSSTSQMIIVNCPLLLRVWFSTTSNVTMLGRTHQGLFVVF